MDTPTRSSVSCGRYCAVRLAAKRRADIGAIVSYPGHFQHPNASEPLQRFSVAPEVMPMRAPVPMPIGDADDGLHRIVNRRAFDLRADTSPEEELAGWQVRAKARDRLMRHLGLDAALRCPRVN